MDLIFPAIGSGVGMHVGPMPGTLWQIFGPPEGAYSNGAGLLPGGQETADNRIKANWQQVPGDATGPQQATTGVAKITLHGKVISVDNFRQMIRNAIRLVMVQKHQSEALLQSRYYEADKVLRMVLAPNEALVRNAKAEDVNADFRAGSTSKEPVEPSIGNCLGFLILLCLQTSC